MTRLDQVLQQSGAPLLGAAVYRYDPEFVEMCSYLGFRVLWFEMEHAPTGLREIGDLCRIASALGILTMIRIPDARRESVLRAAECGPDILDLPMANTAEIMREFVAHARYGPEGSRGFFGASRAVRYGCFGDIAEEQQRINRDLCLLAQIETREAVERADELCRIPGIDGIFLGPGDLSASYGVCGKTGDPAVVDAMTSVTSTARKHGKRVALFSAAKDAGQWAETGADLIFCTSDVACLRAGAQSVVREFQVGLSQRRSDSR
jgi:4-hydroxy-2-oxoheptanedioate aldolase